MLKRILFLLFAVCSLAVYGQNVEVKGKVVDDINDPLPAVGIEVPNVPKFQILHHETNLEPAYIEKATAKWGYISLPTTFHALSPNKTSVRY